MSYGAAAGTLIGAYGAWKAGEDQSDALDYQKQIAQQNARNSMIAAKINASRANMQFQKLQGQDIANYGASGVEGSSGSVLAVLGANAQGAEMDKQNILYGGQLRAINYQNQASVDSVAAGRASQAGTLGAVGGLFLGASRLYGNSISSADDGGG